MSYNFIIILLLLLEAIQAQVAAGQLNQQATLYGQQASTDLSNRGAGIFVFIFVFNFVFILCTRWPKSRTWSRYFIELILFLI